MTRNPPLLSDRFARGFDRGEREAFMDRAARVKRLAPYWFEGEELRGWTDGYTPRNPAWALRTEPVKHFAEVA